MRGDFFVCESFDEELQSPLFAISQPHTIGGVFRRYSNQRAKIVLLNQDLTFKYLANATLQVFGRVVFVKDSGNTRAYNTERLAIRQTCRNKQNFSLKSGASECGDEILSRVRPKIIVEKEHIHFLAENRLESHCRSSPGTDESQVRIGRQQSDQTLAEQGMII